MWQFNTQGPAIPQKIPSATAAVPINKPSEKSPTATQSATSKTEIPDISFLLPLGKSHYQDSKLNEAQVGQLQKLTLRLSDYLDENKKSINDVTEKDILALYDLNAQSPQDEITAANIKKAFKALQEQNKKDYKDYGSIEKWNEVCKGNEKVLENLAEDLTKLDKSPFKVYDSQKFKKVDAGLLKGAQDVEPQRAKGEVLKPAQIKALDAASVEIETLSENVQLFLARNTGSSLEQASVRELFKQLQESTGVDLSTQKGSNKEKLQRYSQILKERTEVLKKSVDVQKTLAVMKGEYPGLENIRMIVDPSQYQSDPAFKLLEPYYSNEQIKASLERYGVKLKDTSSLSLQDKKSLSQALMAIKSLTEVKERKAFFFVGDENYNLRLATQHILEINLHLDSESSNNDPIRKKAADNAKKISNHYFAIKKDAQLGLQRSGILNEFSKDKEKLLKVEQINLNLCGSFPELAQRLAKFKEQDKQRYLQILNKLVKGSIGLEDFMFLSGAENSKGAPDVKTRVSVLREFAIFVKLTPGQHDDEAFQQINDSMLYHDLDPQDPKYQEKLDEVNNALLRLYDKGVFSEIGIEASDFDIAFRLNSNFTSVYEQLGPGTAVLDLNNKPVERTFLKFTDQIDVKNSAILRGNPRIVEKFSEFKDGILTYKEADTISKENKLIRNTPVVEQSFLKTMGRSAFSRTGEVVPGMDTANADTIGRHTLQLGYWMQYVTDVSLDRVDRPEAEMRYLRKEEISGVLDSKSQALKIKRELYRMFNVAALPHPNNGDVLGMDFSKLEEYVAKGEMSQDLLAVFNAMKPELIPDPRNPHQTIKFIADEKMLPFFEAFHIASRGSRVLFNEGAKDVRFNRHKKDKALFMYLNTMFLSEHMTYKHIMYPSLSKTSDPSRPGSQTEQGKGPGASVGLPGSRPLSEEKAKEESKKQPKKEEKPPRTKIAPAPPEGYQNMGDLRSPSDQAKA